MECEEAGSARADWDLLLGSIILLSLTVQVQNCQMIPQRYELYQ